MVTTPNISDFNPGGSTESATSESNNNPISESGGNETSSSRITSRSALDTAVDLWISMKPRQPILMEILILGM